MKKICFVICVLILTFIISSCSDSEKEFNVLGGEIIRYDYCLVNNEWQLATLPLIVEEEINDIKLLSIEMENKEDFSITLESFDRQSKMQYKDYYIYFLVLRVQATNTNEYVKSRVDSLKLNINGKEDSYDISHFYVANGVDPTKYNVSLYNTGDLLFGGGNSNTLIFSSLPTEERPVNIGMSVKNNVKITDFFVTNFFNIEDFSVNKELIDIKDIDLEYSNGDSFALNYSLTYTEGVDETNIVRVARIIIYEENNQKKAFVDGAGMYVFPGYSEYGAVKNYIDKMYYSEG